MYLQETHSEKCIEKLWKSQWGGRIYYLHGTNKARGTAILIAKNTPIKVTHQYSDTDGRVVILQVSLENTKLTLSTLYAPTKDDPEFFQELLCTIIKSGDNHIIGGDWNLVLDIMKDKKGGKMQTHNKSLNIIKMYMTAESLTDIWRMQHPTESRFTWGITNRAAIYERLDFFLVSDQILKNVAHTDIGPIYLSDHAIPFLM